LETLLYRVNLEKTRKNSEFSPQTRTASSLGRRGSSWPNPENIRVSLMSLCVLENEAGNAFIHGLRTFFSGAVHLSIQKLLPESTGSAGLLVRHNQPILFFKKVALSFPPLEQGPAG
jgi:hypothetical protein